jgi:hypothetical protein
MREDSHGMTRNGFSKTVTIKIPIPVLMAWITPGCEMIIDNLKRHLYSYMLKGTNYVFGYSIWEISATLSSDRPSLLMMSLKVHSDRGNDRLNEFII